MIETGLGPDIPEIAVGLPAVVDFDTVEALEEHGEIEVFILHIDIETVLQVGIGIPEPGAVVIPRDDPIPVQVLIPDTSHSFSWLLCMLIHLLLDRQSV